MVKFSRDDKIDTVKRALERKESYLAIAKSIGPEWEIIEARS